MVAGERPKGQILVASTFNPAGGDDAGAVGVKQQQRHQPRVKPLLPTGILALGRDHDRREIQHIHQIEQEIHLVVSGQPVAG